jgi:hypothetical protein
MATTLPVAYAHTIEYFSKGIDQNGPYFHVQYYISNWNDSDRFCNALKGITTVTGPSGAPTVTRGIPHQHPLSPNLVCVSASVVEGLGKPILAATGYPNYDGGAFVQAEYRPAPYDFSGPSNLGNQFDPATPILWCTQELDFATETFTIPDHTFTYSSGPLSGQTSGVPAKFSIPLTTLSLTFHQLPYIPMIAVRALRGRVNSLTFLGAVAGTVLFSGGKTTREYTADGSVVQKVVLTFMERDPLHPWNSLPSRTSLTWYPVSDGTTKMYDTKDLTPLVQF